MKNRYVLDLSLVDYEDNNSDFTSATEANPTQLAELMLEAYRGTIDDEGESLADAELEIKDYLANNPLLDQSLIVENNSSYTSACLVTYLTKQQAPLIAYIMTRPESKRNGHARSILRFALTQLKKAGYQRVLAGITQGNLPSESLFLSLGFKQLD